MAALWVCVRCDQLINHLLSWNLTGHSTPKIIVSSIKHGPFLPDVATMKLRVLGVSAFVVLFQTRSVPSLWKKKKIPLHRDTLRLCISELFSVRAHIHYTHHINAMVNINHSFFFFFFFFCCSNVTFSVWETRKSSSVSGSPLENTREVEWFQLSSFYARGLPNWRITLTMLKMQSQIEARKTSADGGEN